MLFACNDRFMGDMVAIYIYLLIPPKRAFETEISWIIVVMVKALATGNFVIYPHCSAATA